MTSNRVAFFVDGFNVYHSIKEAIKHGGGPGKWLNYNGLCSSYISGFGRNAVLEKVLYFTAYPYFLTATRPDVVARHKRYVRALESTGVDVQIGRFKWRPRYCSTCKVEQPGYEEKETDVAIAVAIMEWCSTNRCDTVVIVSGDTDLLPPIRAARRLYPEKRIWVVCPYKRFNEELRQAADGTKKIRRAKYAKHQLPDPVLLKDGTALDKPASW